MLSFGKVINLSISEGIVREEMGSEIGNQYVELMVMTTCYGLRFAEQLCIILTS